MEQYIEIITINLIPGGMKSACHTKQYDKGRVIRANLVNGLTPYSIKSGDVFTLNVKKPDGNIVTVEVAATEGNTYVDFSTTEQMCAVAGKNNCEFSIENGSDLIGTANFFMIVEESPLEGGIESESEINNLTTQIEEITEQVVGENYYNKTQIDTALDTKADASTVTAIDDTLEYVNYISSTLTENKYADYVNKVVGSLSGINLLTFNVENVSKLLYKYTINSPDLRGLYFTDVNGQAVSGYQAIASEQEITVPIGAVMCYASVNSADDILCYDIYGSLASFRTTLNAFSVRVSGVEDVLNGDQPVEILKAQSSYTNKTSGGVTYTWNSDHTKVTINGKRTATSFDKMCGSETGLPNNMVAGGSYTIDFDPVDANIVLGFLFYESGVNVNTKYFNGRETYTIPSTTTGLVIRLQVINPNSEVNETVDCPSIYTVPSGKGLVERVGDLEEAVFGNDENPLAKIIEDGGMLSLFHTVGCIGDSLSSGECAYKSGGTTHYIDLYPFSWGQCLARMTGNTYYNFSQGGLTTRSWLASSHATDCFDGNHDCDCYFIGLGQNDKNQSLTVGTTADIDLNDYNNNADTYCGNYGKIIQKLQELQPKAPIFCFIDPYPPSDDQSYNNAVKQIVELFNNVWLIDLDKYAKKMYRDSNEIIGSQLRAGHYSALGYQQMAFVIASYVDWIIRHNLSAFSQVEFIGTNYSW